LEELNKHVGEQTMPTCKKCSKRIPCTALINGKRRHLAHRKYCLECNPFGERLYTGPRPDSEKWAWIKGRRTQELETKCVSCERIFVLRKKIRNLKCSSCRNRERRWAIKEKAVLFLGGKCSVCGYNKCIDAIDFHHRDADSKEFNLSWAMNRSWKMVEKELMKCSILCRNCHAEEHSIKGKV
jgi:hypothetical protein